MSSFTPPQQYSLDLEYAHRQGWATVLVPEGTGVPAAEREVVVEQLAHSFRFGNIGFELVDYLSGCHDEDSSYTEEFAHRWLTLFNMATLPFYWSLFEPRAGAPRTAEHRLAAEWFRARRVSLKGHPLVWHTLAPKWLTDLPPEEVEQQLRARIRREVHNFTGLIDTWDAINEAVIMPVFTAEPNGITPLARLRGRVGMIRLAFEEARAANPRVTLILNDFDLSTGYECLIEAVLEADIKIDALGLQSHQHQGYWGREKTEQVLNRFARYNLPIHFTETTLLSGDLMPKHIVDLNDWQVDSWPSTPEGEARQAHEVTEWYRTLFAHPSVAAITYWGLGDRGMWLGAPGGLLRADGSPKPSYHRLRSLIKGEWWLAPTAMRTDETGHLTLSGYLGSYRVTAPDGTSTDFEIV